MSRIKKQTIVEVHKNLSTRTTVKHVHWNEQITREETKETFLEKGLLSSETATKLCNGKPITRQRHKLVECIINTSLPNVFQSISSKEETTILFSSLLYVFFQ